jgi:hypothetical protein
VVTEVEVVDEWAELVSVTPERVLEVARAHGTAVAASWSGWSDTKVRVLRQRVDGYDRGRGHPTRAEIEAMAPSWECSCTRCIVWRWDQVIGHGMWGGLSPAERRRRLVAAS